MCSYFISEAFILVPVLLYKIVRKLDTRWKANKAEVMIAVFNNTYIHDTGSLQAILSVIRFAHEL